MSTREGCACESRTPASRLGPSDDRPQNPWCASCGPGLDQIIEHVRRSRGLDLTRYRRATLRNRLAVRMSQVGHTDATAYLSLVRSDSAECEQLIGALAVNVTSFFRDPLVFEVLAHTVVPEILARADRRKSRELRVWCAGCATGEEAYSVAILFDQALRANAPCRPLIFATDINEVSLQSAKRGVYERDKLEHTKLGVVDQYFDRRDGLFEVRPSVRELVRFSRDDVTDAGRSCPTESVFGAFDLILCRNLLIYFELDLQHVVLDKLHRCLDNDGYLVLGHTERLVAPHSERFIAVDAKSRIYRRR